MQILNFGTEVIDHFSLFSVSLSLRKSSSVALLQASLISNIDQALKLFSKHYLVWEDAMSDLLRFSLGNDEDIHMVHTEKKTSR